MVSEGQLQTLEAVRSFEAMAGGFQDRSEVVHVSEVRFLGAGRKTEQSDK